MSIMVLFLGCMGGAPSYPEWFSNVPQDNDRYIYGIGEGENKKEAMNNALNEIASKIHVSIESSSSIDVHIQTTNHGEEYTKNATQHIQNHVRKTEFSNYKVKKEKQLSSDRYIVLVEVDKPLNAQLLLDRINTHIAKYNQLLSSTNNNPITTVKAYSQAIQTIQNQDLMDCSIIKNFSPSSPVEDHINKLLDIEQKMKAYQSNILFHIQGNSDPYQNILRQAIAEKGFRITQDGDASINIEMNVEEKELSVLGNKILKSTIQMTVKSNGKIIGKSRINVGAKSRSSYRQAREFTLKNFARRLKKEKLIENLLGI